MDQIAQWRPVEPAAPEGQPPPKDVVAPNGGRTSAVLFGAAATLVLGAAGVVLWATTPQPEVVLRPVGQDGGLVDTVQSARPEESAAPAVTEVVVDVQGAVAEPGLHRLPAGSRVGDAIAAAGGYGLHVDVAAAAQRLNLAQPLVDGDKIHVPARGEAAIADPGSSAPATAGTGDPGTAGAGDVGAAGGLIDVNTATEAQLDTLPGIGPVTAGKIIAAREEAAFATVDELLGRKVVGPATFEKIRDLITVGP